MPVLGVDGLPSAFAAERDVPSTDDEAGGGDMSGIDERQAKRSPPCATPSEEERRKTAGGRRRRERDNGESEAQKVIDALNGSLGGAIAGVKAQCECIGVKVDAIEKKLTEHTERIMKLEEFMAKVLSGSLSVGNSAAGSERGSDIASVYGENSNSRGGGLPSFFKRTELVVGGFPRDTERDVVITFIKKILRQGESDAHAGVVDVYTNGPAVSTGKVRFSSPGALWGFIRAKRGQEEAFGSSRIWWTVEKSVKERELSKRISSALAATGDAMIAKGLIPEDKKRSWIGADWGKGDIWVRKEGGRPKVILEVGNDSETYLNVADGAKDFEGIDWSQIAEKANAAA